VGWASCRQSLLEAVRSIRLFHLNTGFINENLHGLFKRPGHGPGTLHLHRETSRAYLDQVTAEHYVYRKPKKGRGRGKIGCARLNRVFQDWVKALMRSGLDCRRQCRCRP
jgi:hypothetical protein